MKIKVEAGPAAFSPDRRYRYALTRTWGDGPKLVVIGLNPSTADETALDNTLRRVVHFANREGFKGFTMLNLFAIRATKPANMKRAAEPVGPDNDRWIRRGAQSAVVLAAWGGHGSFRDRDREVMRILSDAGADVRCLGTTLGGLPLHPLYLDNDTPIVPYGGR